MQIISQLGAFSKQKLSYFRQGKKNTEQVINKINTIQTKKQHNSVGNLVIKGSKQIKIESVIRSKLNLSNYQTQKQNIKRTL